MFVGAYNWVSALNCIAAPRQVGLVCDPCRTEGGYPDELLETSDRIREMILDKRPSSEIRRAAREEGMRFLRESALDRVRGGLTTLKEINKVTFIESSR